MNAKTAVLGILKKENARLTWQQLREATGLSRARIKHALMEIRTERPDLCYGKFDKTYWLANTPTWYNQSTDLSSLPKTGTLGVISDTHLCSVAERLDVVQEAYEIFDQRGVCAVLHCGDLTDGWCEYRNHINFVKIFGDQPQAKYVIEKYPRIKVKTYVIQGNHDDSFARSKVDRLSLITHGFKHEGVEIKGRDDIVYLGQYSHHLIFPEEVKVHLLHPRGGNPYAKSYKQQKRSEEMDRNDRPDLQLSGHFHTFNHIWLNHTHLVSCPGVQDHTEFFVRLGYPRSIGFILIHYTIRNGGFYSLAVELFMRP